MTKPTRSIVHAGRHWLVLAVLTVVLLLLAGRTVFLQILDTEYLKAQGDARYLRTTHIPPSRGMILDRNGEPLAVSTPVDSVWAHPQTLLDQGHSWSQLGKILQIAPSRLRQLCRKNREREFVYLKRHLLPESADRLRDLEIPGIDMLREYRRYYPLGPYMGHLLGFTNVDDVGQEGVELAYDRHLSGIAGKDRVLKDRFGHIVERVERIQRVVNGSNLRVSLDARIQFLAYRYLRAAVRSHRAKGASVVVLDTNTGEVLAMVNEPSFNPNNREELLGSRFRNRAVTDVFEPGSTVKPFTIAMALASGRFGPDTRVDTTPGSLRVGRHYVRDVRDYGLLTVSRVLVKSSNVGAAKIAMTLAPQPLLDMFKSLGFDETTGIGLAGEAAGSLPARRRWRPIEHATLSFGYGLSVTPLQLARAYAVLANGGVLLPLSIVPVDGPVFGTRVMDAKIASEVRRMLEGAVSDHGTGQAARVERYRVAGKTGTVHKVTDSGYADDRYMSVFAGIAPISSPRLAMVVVIDDPRGENYYGGEVAAPVFSQVMAGALRLMNVPPDLQPAPIREAKGGDTGV